MEFKRWLVYLLAPCEQGSDGFSGWAYHSIADGNTDEEIYNNWIENVKKIYDVDLSSSLKCTDGFWSCYYPLCKNELPMEIYGHAEPLYVEKRFRKHRE